MFRTLSYFFADRCICLPVPTHPNKLYMSFSVTLHASELSTLTYIAYEDWVKNYWKIFLGVIIYIYAGPRRLSDHLSVQTILLGLAPLLLLFSLCSPGSWYGVFMSCKSFIWFSNLKGDRACLNIFIRGVRVNSNSTTLFTHARC
jgi:hypothetical protein